MTSSHRQQSLLMAKTIGSRRTVWEGDAVNIVLPTFCELILAILRGPGAAVYGLIDAAQDPEILALIQEGNCPFESLYQGESALVMASVAPYLIQLAPNTTLLETLIVRGWGKNWGIYIRSRMSLPDLRRHLRRFTMVELPDGESAYFRFYDPRVFRVYIPTCSVEECRTILEGIEAILAEGPDGTSAIRYRLEHARSLVIETAF